MSGKELLALSPFLVLAAGGLLTILGVAFRRSHRLTTALAATSLLVALGSVSLASTVAPTSVGSLLRVDGYALTFEALLLLVSFVVCLLAHGYFAAFTGHEEEFSILLLFATLGALTLAASTHFASFFLGLELLSASLYVLIAFVRSDEAALESSLKYVVLAALSSAFLLFGMALLYLRTGTLAWGEVAASAALAPGDGADPWLVSGIGLLIVGIGFKLALVPFHLWSPDVYEGSPAPATALVATLSKAAVFALLFRYFAALDASLVSEIGLVLSALALASMVVGNLLALLEDNVKRLLAYSSIAHFGYLLVALVSGGELALRATGLYLTSYLVTMLGALGVVIRLSKPGDEAERLNDYRGLFWRRPGLAAVFAAMLLSLAGMPLTAGFVGKLYLVAAGISGSQWLLVSTLVAGSVLGLYYYLRVLVTLFQAPVETAAGSPPPSGRWGEGLLLAALTALLVWIGVAPRTVLDFFPTSIAVSQNPGTSAQDGAE